MIKPQSYFNTPNTQQSFPLRSLQHHMNITEISPGLSQPVWGPEIATVGAYSREGYTSKTADIPAIDFRSQALALQIDEDIQYSINNLASQVTGGEHYIKTVSEEITKYMTSFSHDIDFDTFDTILIKELLWYGNSVWKPRMGIRNITSFDDLMHIPISSFVRIWWDRQRQPYKYEFRGAEYQGYHNVGEVLHFTWNPVDASLFGTGFGVAVTSPRVFDMIVNGDKVQNVTLPSMLDRKYATQFIMQMATQRYVSRNIYSAVGASEEERNELESFVEQLQIGQDLVIGSKVEVQELGTNTRTFNPTEFVETVSAPIMKGLNDFSGKQGSENSHTFANAETAKEESDGGLAAFTINIKTQLANKLFKPWYESNPYMGDMYLDGLIPLDWKDIKFEFNFGKMEKKDIPVEELIKLIESYQNNPILMQNTKPLIDMYKMAGVPINDDTAENINNMYNDPTGQMALNNVDDTGENNGKENVDTSQKDNGKKNIQFNNQSMGDTPMDNYMYDDMIKDVRGNKMIGSIIPSDYHQSDVAQDFKTGRYYETKK